MNDKNWNEAQELAKRAYSIRYDRDKLSENQVVILAQHPELPGCKAYGDNMAEADENLAEATIDYIYALLERGLPVPPPATALTNLDALTGSSSTSGDFTPRLVAFNASSSGADFEDVLEEVARPGYREVGVVISFGGDFIKHR